MSVEIHEVRLDVIVHDILRQQQQQPQQQSHLDDRMFTHRTRHNKRIRKLIVVAIMSTRTRHKRQLILTLIENMVDAMKASDEAIKERALV